MKNPVSAAAVALRVLLGWYMFFAGIEKVLNPEWSASGFLLSAKTFSSLYAWFGAPAQSIWIDPLNAWGITLIGVALLLGVAVRFAAFAGAALMIVYYFPHYAFPFILPHGFIVEEHLIYAAAFVLIALLPDARKFSLAPLIRKTGVGKLPFMSVLLK